MTDHLPPDAREAHNRMLEAWDALTESVLRREGPAAEAKARAEGKAAHEAAQAAQDHVNRLLIEMTRARARLEAEGARLQ
jgi:hypothetical protein